MPRIKKRFLLVNPSYRFHYRHTKIKEGAIYPPPLNLATLGASLQKHGYEVKAVDFNLLDVDENSFIHILNTFLPDYTGFTFSTPLFKEMDRLCRIVKDVNRDIITVGGGVHVSSLPMETLRDSALDMVITGEADFILPRIVEREPPPGILIKNGMDIYGSSYQNHVVALDSLPFPLWKMFPVNQYRMTSLLSRRNPAAFMETSRGCPFRCPYCSKSVFGGVFRKKSAERVIEEMQYMKEEGFNEIFIADDNFSCDIDRAKDICEKIISRKLNIPWTPLTGLRIDRVDRELLKLMCRSGCYRVYFGIESGNQQMLDEMGKGITLSRIRDVVEQSKDAGMEVFGFFMIGFPGETVKAMMDTIHFSRSLRLDMAKLSILTPLPDTPIFKNYEKAGLIKTRNWSRYNLYDIDSVKEVYTHPVLDWSTISKFYHRFYRAFYLRPSFIMKRMIKSMKEGTFFKDMLHFINTRWW